MKSVNRRLFTVLLSGLLVGLPLFASGPRGLVGIAQGTGAIKINGQPFGGQASLFSGDRIETGRQAPLTVITSASERMRFESETSAQVAKKQQGTVIRLNGGAVDFQTAGVMSAELPDGITVRPKASVLTMARVDRLANGNAEVAVYKGAVEIASASEKMSVAAGHTARLSPPSNAQSNNQNNHKKKVWAIFISTGLSAGAVGAILANEQSNPVSVVDP